MRKPSFISNLIHALKERLGWCPEPPTRKTEKTQEDFKSYGWTQTFSGRFFAASLFFTVVVLALLILSSDFRIQSFSNWVYFFLGILINLVLSIVAVSYNAKALEAKGEAKIPKITNWKYTLAFFSAYFLVYFVASFFAEWVPMFLPIISGIALPNFWFWWLSQVLWEKKNKKIIVVSEGKVRIRGRD